MHPSRPTSLPADLDPERWSSWLFMIRFIEQRDRLVG